MSRRGSEIALAVLFLFAILVLAGLAKAKDRDGGYDLYLVAVGSSFYAEAQQPDEKAFSRIFGGNKSARFVATRLHGAGAKYGVLLTSAREKFITVQDIYSAIDHVTAQIKRDGSERPLFLFYFAGHGISEGVGWHQFLVPGNFLYRGSLVGLNVEALGSATLSASALVNKLDDAQFRYIAILDACYEGDEAKFESPVLEGPAVDSLRSVANILRFMNEFRHQSPVLFSTPPGSVVSTVEDPTASSPEQIAPSARRITLALDTAAGGGNPMTVSEFINLMKSRQLDTQTLPAVTNAEPAEDWRLQFLTWQREGRIVKEMQGSATRGEVCCEQAPIATNDTQTDRVAGRVTIRPEDSDYISQGYGFDFQGDLAVNSTGSGTISAKFEQNGEEWELQFSTPDDTPFAVNPTRTRSGFRLVGPVSRRCRFQLVRVHAMRSRVRSKFARSSAVMVAGPHSLPILNKNAIISGTNCEGL